MRKPSVDKNGVKKGTWSEEEDNKLRSYILRYGHWNWRLLPKFAGLARCGKSCRLRWVNYLKPGLKRGSFTKEEENLIAKLHDELGNKWSAMAAIIPGRTDNEIKNFWHTHLKKRSTKVPAASAQSPSSSQCKNNAISENFQTCEKLILESSETLNSPNPAAIAWDSEDSASSSDSANIEVQESMLSEEGVVAEKCETRIGLDLNDDKCERVSDGFVESFWSQPFVVDTSYCHDHVHYFTPLMEAEEAAIYLFT